MEKLYSEFNQCIDEDLVEHNSGLGNAMRYFIKHFDGLTQFCKVEGAPIDNNRMEAALKWVVRDRKNAMFHKTLLGATIADIVTSIIATAANACINVFDYLNVPSALCRQSKRKP